MARVTIAIVAALILAGFALTLCWAASTPELSTGQTLYLSIYSHIYGGPKSRPIDLTATVSIRNTDSASSIRILSLKYYNSNGALLKEYLTKPLQLGRYASVRFIVEELDKSGGSGANFIVKWTSTRKVNPPVVEGVHIGTRSGQGISFITQARIIMDHGQ